MAEHSSQGNTVLGVSLRRGRGGSSLKTDSCFLLCGQAILGLPVPPLQGPFPEKPLEGGVRSACLEGLLHFLWGRQGLGFTWTMSRSASFPREEIRTSSPSSSTMAVGGEGQRHGVGGLIGGHLGLAGQRPPAQTPTLEMRKLRPGDRRSPIT